MRRWKRPGHTAPRRPGERRLVDAWIVQRQDRGDGEAGVGELVIADQAGGGQVDEASFRLDHQASALFIGVEIAAHEGEGRSQPVRLGLDRG